MRRKQRKETRKERQKMQRRICENERQKEVKVESKKCGNDSQ